MNPLTLIGVFAVIMSVLQMTVPGVILSLRPFGVKTKEAVKIGGYFTLPVGIGFIIVSLII